MILVAGLDRPSRGRLAATLGTAGQPILEAPGATLAWNLLCAHAPAIAISGGGSGSSQSRAGGTTFFVRLPLPGV